MRTFLLIVACVGVSLVATSPALADVQAKLTTSSKTPRVGEAWRWTITARDGAKPARVRVRLQILLGGTVVGCFKAKAMAACTGAAAGDLIGVTGKRTGVIRWPAQSIGARLTFQAVVITTIGTLRLRAPVTVAPAGSA
jgi:hypothetical protein